MVWRTHISLSLTILRSSPLNFIAKQRNKQTNLKSDLKVLLQVSDLPNAKQMWQPVKAGGQADFLRDTRRCEAEQSKHFISFFPSYAIFLTLFQRGTDLSCVKKHNKHKHALHFVAPPHRLTEPLRSCLYATGPGWWVVGDIEGMQTRCWADVDKG